MRRKLKLKRKVELDPTFQSAKVAKLTNYLMMRGQKATARGLVYGAFDLIKEKMKQEPLMIYEEALKNAGPQMELRSRRVGGANYQIPHEVTPDRRLALSLRWIIAAARARKGLPMATRLAEELILASKNEGEAIKKKEMVHKMAEANRAFAHFARVAHKPKLPTLSATA